MEDEARCGNDTAANEPSALEILQADFEFGSATFTTKSAPIPCTIDGHGQQHVGEASMVPELDHRSKKKLKTATDDMKLQNRGIGTCGSGDDSSGSSELKVILRPPQACGADVVDLCDSSSSNSSSSDSSSSDSSGSDSSGSDSDSTDGGGGGAKDKDKDKEKIPSARYQQCTERQDARGQAPALSTSHPRGSSVPETASRSTGGNGNGVKSRVLDKNAKGLRGRSVSSSRRQTRTTSDDDDEKVHADDSSVDSGFIPLHRPLAPAPFSSHTQIGPNITQGRARSPASTADEAKFTSRTAIAHSPALPGNSLHESAAFLKAGVNSKSQKEKLRASLESRLWPSAARFYRAVLRWVYIPEQGTIREDSHFRNETETLRTVPTEFGSVAEYQGVFSSLLFKETLASLQQELLAQHQRKTILLRGEVSSGRLADLHRHGLSGGSEARIYSLKVRFLVPPSELAEPSENVSCPFFGGDLVMLQSPRWASSGGATLGVVQSFDPKHDRLNKRKRGGDAEVFLRVLVCANNSGGDGARGPGGWIRTSYIQECLGTSDPDRGVPVSVGMVGSVMSAFREFQAIMSLSSLSERMKGCLLTPRTGKVPAPRRAASDGLLRTSVTRHHTSGELRDADRLSPPPNVPRKLWRSVLDTYNASQVAAIRQVAIGSPAGFTLLQGPPGTGKTRTIMGIVGILLAGGCPTTLVHDSSSSGQHSKFWGAKVTVGASVNLGKGKGKVPSRGKGKGALNAEGSKAGPMWSHVDPGKEIRHPRVLVVAPSNAAVDELVIRLCQHGVPAPNGGVLFPKVVRVGSAKRESEDAGVVRRGAAVGGGGDDGTTSVRRQTFSATVEAVRLEHMVAERRKTSQRSALTERLDVLLKADVVCATLSGSGSQALIETILKAAERFETTQSKACRSPGKKRGKPYAALGDRDLGHAHLTFDAVVMDEAAQAVEPSLLIPLKLDPRAVIMVGDPAQLPATLFSTEAKNANYGQSLFQRLQRGGHPKMMLDMQYRMHPSIASFASRRFYHGLLRSAPMVTEASHRQNFHALPRFAPYLFHHVASGRLLRGGSGAAATSLSNPREVEYIVSLLRDLVGSFRDTDFNGRIGIIAPYLNQIEALKRAMRRTALRRDGVEISTVDGFQGREKDIMIFSCVRAPETPGATLQQKGGIGFMNDWRRLNVAITRAKCAMWIVGHAGVLKQDKEWRELVDDSKRRKAFVDNSVQSSATGDTGRGDMTTSGTAERVTEQCSGNLPTPQGGSGVRGAPPIAAATHGIQESARESASTTASTPQPRQYLPSGRGAHVREPEPGRQKPYPHGNTFLQTAATSRHHMLSGQLGHVGHVAGPSPTLGDSSQYYGGRYQPISHRAGGTPTTLPAPEGRHFNGPQLPPGPPQIFRYGDHMTHAQSRPMLHGHQPYARPQPRHGAPFPSDPR